MRGNSIVLTTRTELAYTFHYANLQNMNANTITITTRTLLDYILYCDNL